MKEKTNNIDVAHESGTWPKFESKTSPNLRLKVILKDFQNLIVVVDLQSLFIIHLKGNILLNFILGCHDEIREHYINSSSLAW